MGDFMGRHILDTEQLKTEDIVELMDLAEDLQNRGPAIAKLAEGKILGTLFWEPSTRTRLSFESAMYRLGGRVIGFSEAMTSSVAKGESLADTIRTVALYTDIIAMRHSLEGSAYAASQYSRVPIINGGDGAHLHPTQTLGDMYTLKKEKGDFKGLRVGFMGDLLFGRTVHTLVRLLLRFGVDMAFFPVPGLGIPGYVRDTLEQNQATFSEYAELKPHISSLDVLYVTRLQKERFFSEEEFLRKQRTYGINKDLLEQAKKDLLILHPLPRNQEIPTNLDDLPNAGYFRQAEYGLHMRVALISACLGVI